MTSYTTEQQAENRAKWVEALRSGEFEQGREALYSCNYITGQPQYCCLGVARELAGRAGVPGFDGDDGLTPNQAVQDWLGLTDECGDLRDPVEYTGTDGEDAEAGVLTTLNDSVRYTFAQIADLIERGQVRTQ